MARKQASARGAARTNKREPPRRKRGRPSKYTPEIRAKILDAISAGNYREVAAGVAGVAPCTLRDWAKNDPDFSAAIDRAEHKAEARMLAIVTAAAAKDAKHAEWYLERKWHDRWGRKDRIESRHVDKDGEDLPPAGIMVVPLTTNMDEWRAKYGPRS